MTRHGAERLPEWKLSPWTKDVQDIEEEERRTVATKKKGSTFQLRVNHCVTTFRPQRCTH